MLTGTILIKPLKRTMNRDDKKECEIRPYRPALVKGGQPAPGIREMPLQGYLLICKPGIGITIRYHQSPVIKGRPDDRCTVHRMIRDKEERLGDRINLLGDGLTDDPSDPCCTGLTGKEGINIGELLLQRGKEGALPRAVNPLDRYQQKTPLLMRSSGMAPV